MNARIFVVVSDSNEDEYFVCITTGDESARVSSNYKLTEEEYVALKKTWKIESESSWSVRHGGMDCKIDASIPARILPDGTSLPDIQKHWEDIFPQ